MKSLSKFLYLIKEGIKSIFTHGFMSFASASIILACLVIMGSFALLSFNISAMIDKLEQQNEVIAFVADGTSEKDTAALRAKIEAVPNVDKVVFESRNDAFNAFKAQEGNQTSFVGIEASDFRDRYHAFVSDIALTQQTADQIGQIPGIAQVNTHLDVVNGFISVRNIINIVTLVLAAILFVVSVFIMTNTIKLATFVRREEIGIMKMVGASNAFIRFPFVIEGLILGLIGSGLAFLAEWGIYNLVNTRVMSGLAGQLVTVVPFAQFQYPMLLAYLGVGLFVGVFGSLIAIRNYLKV
ncbi:MAG: permease-like cell division protein FtsX [Firmicutes bacterium]|nr:permease-like cell division protein FtsX [Bacillota bacterium]